MFFQFIKDLRDSALDGPGADGCNTRPAGFPPRGLQDLPVAG